MQILTIAGVARMTEFDVEFQDRHFPVRALDQEQAASLVFQSLAPMVGDRIIVNFPNETVVEQRGFWKFRRTVEITKLHWVKYRIGLNEKGIIIRYPGEDHFETFDPDGF
jgi:hypothetical protein